MMDCARSQKTDQSEIGLADTRRNEYKLFDQQSRKPHDPILWHEVRRPSKLLLISKQSDLAFKNIFRKRTYEWRTDTDGWSSTEDVISHPAYLKIIGTGSRVLPLILEELRDHGGRWYVALEALSEENPVRPEDLGYTNKMKEAWLKWGRKNHYL